MIITMYPYTIADMGIGKTSTKSKT